MLLVTQGNKPFKILNGVVSRHLPAHQDRFLPRDLNADGFSASYFVFEQKLAHEPVAWLAGIPTAPKAESLPPQG